MHTIKIELSDSIYDKVMFFLKNLPQTDIKLYNKETPNHNDNIVNFFANSPLKDISLERDSETYQGRVNF